MAQPPSVMRYGTGMSHAIVPGAGPLPKKYYRTEAYYDHFIRTSPSVACLVAAGGESHNKFSRPQKGKRDRLNRMYHAVVS